MSKIVKLKATSRGRAGKGASRAVRREGLVPAVVYGDKQDPQMLTISYRDLEPHVHTGRFMSTLVDLDVDGKVVRAIARDVQFEPVRDFIIHVDFLRLGKASRIAVEVPLVFKGQDVAPGVKAGGKLNIISHQLNLYCSSDFIPDQITVDLSGLQIAQSVHTSDIKLPDGVSLVSTDDMPLVTITSQSKEDAAGDAPASAEVPATAQKAAAAGKAAAPAKGAAPAAAPKKK